MGTGCDKIDDAALTAAGIALLNVPEFCTEEMADHSFALLLSIVRKLPQMQQAVVAGRWTSSRLECQAIPRLRGTTIGEHNRLLTSFSLGSVDHTHRAVSQAWSASGRPAAPPPSEPPRSG